MKRKIFFVVLGALTMLNTVGCTSPKVWNYTPNNYDKSNKQDKNVTIKTFEDTRTKKDKGELLIGYIPFIPFGWESSETPEKRYQKSWTFDPKNDYTKALESELRSTGDFNSVDISDETCSEGIIIEGKILSTKFNAKMFTYGFSVLAGFAWYLGAPSLSYKNYIRLELTCKDASTGDLLFNKIYENSSKEIAWVYVAKESFLYPDLLQEIYGEFCTDLKNSRVYE